MVPPSARLAAMSTNFAHLERQELCDLFTEVGPDVDTLCEGWTTRDLAAHLVVRERRPDAALGILASPLARHGDNVRRQTAQRPWPELIELVRSGPPRWSLMGLPGVDRAANTLEYFIHHEDVRRAVGRSPRDLPAELEHELWKIVSRMSKLMMRRSPVGIELICGDRSVTPKTAERSVRVSGEVGELALFTYGRQAHAVVEVEGSPTDVDAAISASFGI